MPSNNRGATGDPNWDDNSDGYWDDEDVIIYADQPFEITDTNTGESVVLTLDQLLGEHNQPYEPYHWENIFYKMINKESNNG